MSRSVHILGICGTFMGGIALLARELGYEVSGSDSNVYPPMSTLLQSAGIDIKSGFKPEHLSPMPDLVVIGNALSRGHPAVEYVLDHHIPYVSGPQWLGENLLRGRWVAAISGTHGKTTTSSMLTWILECAGKNPGFLIGGVPGGFEVSARLGSGPFVVEADEYDSAFFDKRSKFIHYSPQTLVINNLEFDHADIFADLDAIQTQFHHLIRCVPASGKIFCGTAAAIDNVLARGCWTPVERLNGAGDEADSWHLKALTPSHSKLLIRSPRGEEGEIQWSLIGRHNAENALAAVAAASDVGVSIPSACAALSTFKGVKRRLEFLGSPRGVSVYDDFAHHPTAIESTLSGLRAAKGRERIVAVIEMRSNTMKSGTHAAALIPATRAADAVYWFEPEGLGWSLSDDASYEAHHQIFDQVSALHDALVGEVRSGDHVVIMSNGSFSGLHQLLLQSLA